ncbi:MAG TPA: hypothetical protein VHC22_13555 [Pirellulales bacterium]|nr:hypothetical protein [Pirellulales bacterium]
MISFFCPFCKHVLKAPDELAGQSIPCEQCKLDIRVPSPAAPPAAAPAAGQTSPTPWWKRLLGRGESHAGG